ncbi:MAG: SUMF1/EgtB/PvdO family nonheme iron enzyme, partial [Polyangiaceae bacterium]
MRLPTEAEWEVAAAASTTRADGSSDPVWQAELLELYSKPAPARLPRVGGAPNFWGIRDLHGVVWEWVLDFSSSEPVDCGQGGRAGANGNFDFASFERAAMRSAPHADTTTPNLGFRCAADLPPRGSS